MSIVPRNTPMTARLCRETVEALQQRYPFLTIRELTKSAWGNPVQAVTVGSGTRRVLYTAAHHGNEWITATLLLVFLEALCQAAQEEGALYGVPAKPLLETAAITLVPMVDPDGVDLVTGGVGPGTEDYEAARRIAARYPDIPFPQGWKANGLGVDLNLQYPAGWLRAREIKFAQGYTRPAPRDYVGRAPLDQTESRALAELARELEPALVLAYHTQGQVIYWQFEDYQVPGAQALAEEFARVSGYALEDTPANSAYAGFKDWFIQDFRRPGFTIEAGSGENPLPLTQLEEMYRDNLGILVTAAQGKRAET